MFGRRLKALEDRLAALESTAPPSQRPRQPLDRPHVHADDSVRAAPDVQLRAGEDTPIHLHEHVTIYRASELTGPLTVEAGAFMNRGAYVQGHVTIGRRVAIGQHVRILTDTHQIGGPESRAGKKDVKPVRIGAGAWLGAGCTVLPGVTVGEGAVVAAGAVVAHDVEPHTLVAGVPARVVRRLDDAQTPAPTS